MVADDRRPDRAHIAVAAGLRTARGTRLAITVRNISLNGFMAEGGRTMMPGAPVALDMNGIVIEARIIWKRAGHIGGAFLQPIDGATLIVLEA
ncbi:PilZ domain-containing protein [Sphingomonas sp.]|uniref:PilZ domain-containing protein n=1 Tax=Sphingomonas sp. TaxID=28214 RepID=UPI00345D04EE